MRAMIILYVGPYSRPDFTTDHLLCPAVAPEPLLSRFPKTYILTGERDPLVDDTVLFAGRLRQAKLHLFQERKELGLESARREFDEKEFVEVALIPGVSHGFVQFVSVYPEGWKHVFRCARWIEDIFAETPRVLEARGSKGRLAGAVGMAGNSASGLEMNGIAGTGRGRGGGVGSGGASGRHHRRIGTAESSGDEDRPLEMSSMHSSTGTPPPPPVSAPSSILGRKGTPEPGATPAAKVNGTAKDRGYRVNVHAKDQHSITSGPAQERMSPEEEKRRHHARTKSATSLGSEEDLLGRRMNGLTVGLMGDGGHLE
jgi:alpha/beta hydrolase fold